MVALGMVRGAMVADGRPAYPPPATHPPGENQRLDAGDFRFCAILP
jgi:hypothetical protein